MPYEEEPLLPILPMLRALLLHAPPAAAAATPPRARRTSPSC